MPWVSVIVFLPALGALAMLALPQDAGGLRGAKALALLSALGTAVLVAILVGLFDRDRGTLQFVNHQDWVSSVGLSYDVGVDGISIWLFALTALLFLLAVLYVCARPPERVRGFLALLLVAETGLLGLFSAGDLILFYVFWEAMLVPFYFLIGMWGGRNRGPATLKFVIYTMVGSLLMLVAMLSTAFIARDLTGVLTFNIEDLRGVAFSEAQSTWLFAGFAIAFVIKLPIWPFHAWLPDAYSAAPIVVTGLLAAVMSKAGVYGLLRIAVPLFPEGADRFAIPLGVLALIGIVYGSLLAWRATTMRLLVGYSSLAHLGFIVLGIVAFDVQGAQGAVLQMVNHGIVVAAAFAIVGIISERMGREGVDDIGGLARGAPRLAAIFLIVAMASLAVPGSNAFVGEFFILVGVFRHHAWLAVLACIGIAYAAVYMLRLYQTSMNGPERGGEGSRAELKPRDLITLAPLTALMLLIALWPAAIVGATRGSLERALAPAQIAAERPADQIRATVERKPPASQADVPFPGEQPAAETPPPAEGTP